MVKKLSPQKKAWITRRKGNKNKFHKRAELAWKTRRMRNTPEKEYYRKIMANLFFIANRSNLNSLILESPSLYFIEHLREYKNKSSPYHKTEFNKGKIFIPNHLEFNKFPKIKENNIYLSNESYQDFVKRTKDKFSFVWADYCGTFNTYKLDIYHSFQNQIFDKTSIFALTFCSRDINKSKWLNGVNNILLVSEYVCYTAGLNGYIAIPLSLSKSYKRGMYSVIFKIIQLNQKIYGHFNDVNSIKLFGTPESRKLMIEKGYKGFI